MSSQAKKFEKKKQTHYEVLQVDNTASLREIKNAYNAMVRRSHPDRISTETSSECSLEFISIQNAWEVLRDSKKRKEYDKSLQTIAYRCNKVPIAYCVALNDCDEFSNNSGESGSEFEYACRCGDYFEFTVTKQQISECDTIIMQCDTCCLNLKVILS